MSSTLKLIKKNLKLLVRSKSSALIVVFGPMLIIFLVGLAFDNSNAYSVSVGSYSEEYNDLSNSFLSQLKEENFKVTTYNDEQSCSQGVSEGDIHLCMVFPKGFEYGKPGANELVFHIDYSKINLVYAILDIVSQRVGEKTEELSKDLTNTLLTVIEGAKSSIKEQKKTVGAMFIDNNEISEEVDKIKESIELINTEMGAQAKHFSDVKNRTAWINELAAWVATYATDSLQGVKGQVNLIGNLSDDDTDRIGTMVSESIVKIGYLTNQINNKSTELQSYIDEIDSSLAKVESKLGSATSQGPLFEQISNVRKKISVTFNNLVKVQEALNTIDDSISNIRVTDAENIVKPVTTTIKPVTSMKTHLNYLFPSLIVLVIMFVSVFLSSTLVVMEKTSPAYFRNYIAPTSDITFIVSTFITSMILMIIQLAVIMGVSSLFFKSQIWGNMHNTFVVLLLAATLFTLVGMVIGYLFNSEETSTLAAISVGSIFMLLSDVILPLESMPYYMMSIAKFNPFVISEFLLRRTIIFQSHLGELVLEVSYMIGYILLLGVLALLFQQIMKRHYLTKQAKKFMPIKKEKAKEKEAKK